MEFHRLSRFAAFFLVLAVIADARAQIVVSGVKIEPSGSVSVSDSDAKDEVAKARRRLAMSDRVGGKLPTGYVSLSRLFAEAEDAIDQGREIPRHVRYVGGLTQIKYVFVYPDENDIILAGTAEDVDDSNPYQAVGKRTGRPVLQLEDFVVLYRLSLQRDAKFSFGCTIDLPPDAMTNAQRVMDQFGTGPQDRLLVELARAIGPQPVTVMGVPVDSRIATVCVAADYQMKRLFMGLDGSPVTGVGHGIAPSSRGASRTWFEVDYLPLRATSDGLSFEIRGSRLKVLAGAIPFVAKDATPQAAAFAKRFTDRMSAMASAYSSIADLQNVADWSIVVALMRKEKLLQRAEMDLAWLSDGGKFPVRSLPAPRSAQTLVTVKNASVAAGGVMIDSGNVTAESAREVDPTGDLQMRRPTTLPSTIAFPTESQANRE